MGVTLVSILGMLFLLIYMSSYSLTGSYIKHIPKGDIWPTKPVNVIITFTSPTEATWQLWDAYANPIGAPCTPVPLTYSVKDKTIAFMKGSSVVAKGDIEGDISSPSTLHITYWSASMSTDACSFLANDAFWELGDFHK